MPPRRPRPDPLSPERASAVPAAPPPGSRPGVVVRAFGKFFEVELADGAVLLATVRGSLRRERRRTDLVAVGDRVWATDVGEGEGQIDAVEPRIRVLARLARNTHDTEQVILANPDRALFLFAVREPDPHRRMLDRFLVLAESQNLPAAIGVAKMDLDTTEADGAQRSRRLFGDYERAYPVFYLSARTGEGMPELAAALRGKITAVAGPSGVGKSSLLNVLDPAGLRQIGPVSDATGKGRHTTTATILRRLPGEPPSFVADTPGIRSLSLQAVPPASLDRLFPELRPYLGACFYADCTHLHEPGCAVLEAVAAGDVGAARYESYAAMRRGESLE